jgi:hypothetical protein
VIVSFVLRLVAEGLEHGVVAGEVHVVGSGERVVVRDQAELLSVLRDQGVAAPATEEES